jgi:uncharacterized membrane protein YsdA (DUF1294 family)
MASAKNEPPINSSRKLPIANPQRRLSERSILWYPVTGGGPGILSAALIYKHKTLHKALLVQAALATVLVYSVAIAGFSTTI